MSTQDLFETKYEDDFLRRDLGAVVREPDVALTELIANAHDAGATVVRITIPSDYGQLLSVEDNGVGMTEEHLKNRWMMLRYDRTQRQGPNVDFPKELKGLKRKAYGRNGIGRHGILCFGNEYDIETWRDGISVRLGVAAGGSKNPLEVRSRSSVNKEGHGTRLTVPVSQNLWSGDRVSESERSV